MTSNVVLFGVGAGSEMAFRYLAEDSPFTVVGFVVDDNYVSEAPVASVPVVGLSEVTTAFPPAEVNAFVPLGFRYMNRARAEKYQTLKQLGYAFITYVHSSNWVPKGTPIGENCLILENQSINHGVAIGNNVVVWSGCQLGDRSTIGDHAWLSSHVCVNGDVEIGESCFLGSNCTVSHGVVVAERSFIGANALITKNTDPGAVHIVEHTTAAGMDSSQFMRLVRGGRGPADD